MPGFYYCKVRVQVQVQFLSLKIQELGSALIEFWNLIDMPLDEQKRFDRVTRFISASVDEVSGQGCLPLDDVEQTEIEAWRLNILKARKMKELILKKQNELEEIYKAVHIDVDSDTAQKILLSLIDSGMDDQITKAKEQALGSREILNKKNFKVCEYFRKFTCTSEKPRTNDGGYNKSSYQFVYTQNFHPLFSFHHERL
ncbi:hypothetical protein AAC387_Pa09g1283 [Persea americana]